MNRSKAQIIATVGPASASLDKLRSMISAGMDVARLNFSWSSPRGREADISLVRSAAQAAGRRILILQDLPGPRIQSGAGHSYDHSAISGFTDADRELVTFGVHHGVDAIAVSFVRGPEDVMACRDAIRQAGGSQKVIAKIERPEALAVLDEIVAAADGVMVARGDLGSEMPIEQIPFIQARIVEAANAAGKTAITATQMMLSMVGSSTPTRAEVTDVAVAILQGSDAVMLSEETAIGRYPVEAVAAMERVTREAERHLSGRRKMHLL